MQDLSSLLESLRQQRPVEWAQLPDSALYMDQVLSYMDRLVKEELQGERTIPDSYAAFCGSLDKALNLTADEMEAQAPDQSLADAAIHFALLSYAAGVASSRYVTLLRQQKEAAQEPHTKKSKKEHD